jgi:WD40 repeat protein
VKVCDPATLQVRRELPAQPAHAPFITSALSADGQKLATLGDDKSLKLWRLSSGERLQTWAMKAEVHRHTYFALEFSPDGKLLALGGQDPYLYLWDARAGKELKVRRVGHSSGFVGLLAFSPDGRWLACQSSNGPAILEVATVLAGK